MLCSCIRIEKWINVGLNRINCIGFTVSEIAKQVINDLRQLGRKGRIINSWDSKIKSNEYRIAVRITLNNMVKCIGQYDYHFMVQHNDGRWSLKPG